MAEVSGQKGALKAQLQILKKPPARRNDLDLKALVSSFSRVKFFQDLTEPLQTQVCRFIQLDKAPRDTAVFRQGDSGDKFYLILSGSVGVYYEEVEAGDADAEVKQSSEEAANLSDEEDQVAQIESPPNPDEEGNRLRAIFAKAPEERSPSKSPGSALLGAISKLKRPTVVGHLVNRRGSEDSAASALPDIAEDTTFTMETPLGRTFSAAPADMSDPEIKAHHAYAEECGRTGRRNAITGHAMLAAIMAVRRPSQQMLTFASLKKEDSEGEEEEEEDDLLVEEDVEEETITDDEEVEDDDLEEEADKKDSDGSDDDKESSSSSSSSSSSEAKPFKIGGQRDDLDEDSIARPITFASEEDAEGTKTEPRKTEEQKKLMMRRQSTWKKVKAFNRALTATSLLANPRKMTEIKILKAGDYFGEIALQTDEPRKATVRTKEETIFATLTRADYKAILQGSWQKQQEERHIFLKGLPVLSGVATQGIQKISTMLQTRTLSRNESVVDYGSPVLQVYIVESGRFSVSANLPGTKGAGEKSVVVSFLAPQSVFGLANCIQGHRYHNRRVVCESSHGVMYTILAREFVGYVNEEQRNLLDMAWKAENLFFENRLSVLQKLHEVQHLNSSMRAAGRRWRPETTLWDRIRKIKVQEARQAPEVYAPEGRLQTIGLAFQQQLRQEQEQRQQQQESMLMRLAADRGENGELHPQHQGRKKRSKSVGLKACWRMEEVVSTAASGGKADSAMLHNAIWTSIAKDGFEDVRISGASQAPDAKGMANFDPKDGLAAEFSASTRQKKEANAEVKGTAGSKAQEEESDWPKPKRPPDSSMPAESTSGRIYSQAMVEFNLRKAQAALHKQKERGHRLEPLAKPAEEVDQASSSASAEAQEAKEGYLEVLKEEHLDSRIDETDAPGMQLAALEARGQLSVPGEGASQPGSRVPSRPSSRVQLEVRVPSRPSSRVQLEVRVPSRPSSRVHLEVPAHDASQNQEAQSRAPSTAGRFGDSEPNDAAGELPEVQKEDAPVKLETTTTTLDVDPVADQSSLRLPSLATPADIFSPELVAIMDGGLELQKGVSRPWTVPSLSQSKALPWAEDLVHLQQVYVPRKPSSRRSPRKSNKEKGWSSLGWSPAATCTGWM